MGSGCGGSPRVYDRDSVELTTEVLMSLPTCSCSLKMMLEIEVERQESICGEEKRDHGARSGESLMNLQETSAERKRGRFREELVDM